MSSFGTSSLYGNTDFDEDLIVQQQSLRLGQISYISHSDGNRRPKSQSNCQNSTISSSSCITGLSMPPIPTLMQFVAFLHLQGIKLILPEDIEKGKLLGQGASMIVYAGKWKEKAVAIKFLNLMPDIPEAPDDIQTPAFFRQRRRRKFEDAVKHLFFELKCISHPGLSDHPNIVKLIGAGFIGNPADLSTFAPLLVVELALEQTPDLDRYLQHHSSGMIPADGKILIQLISGIAEGLIALHIHGIAHTDLKPANILLFRNNGPDDEIIPKIADFSFSSIEAGGNLDHGGQTADWAPPEYVMTTCDIPSITLKTRQRADIYTFGLVTAAIVLRKNQLYANTTEALEAKRLAKEQDIMAQRLFDENVSEIQRADDYFQRLQNLGAVIIQETLCQKPSGRWQSLTSVRIAINEYCGSSLNCHLDSRPTDPIIPIDVYWRDPLEIRHGDKLAHQTRLVGLSLRSTKGTIGDLPQSFTTAMLQNIELRKESREEAEISAAEKVLFVVLASEKSAELLEMPTVESQVQAFRNEFLKEGPDFIYNLMDEGADRFESILSHLDPMHQLLDKSDVEQRLLLAILHGTREDLEEIIRSESLDEVSNSGSSLFNCAAYVNRLEILEILKRAFGTNCFTSESDRLSPIHVAAVELNAGALMWLLENGANINSGATLEIKGQVMTLTPLLCLAFAPNADTAEGASAMKLLLSRGADPRDSYKGGAPLIHALVYKSNYLLSTLLNFDPAVVNQRDPANHSTALHLAAFLSQHAAAKMLLESNADANAANIWNKTPFDLAWVAAMKASEPSGKTRHKIVSEYFGEISDAFKMAHLLESHHARYTTSVITVMYGIRNFAVCYNGSPLMNSRFGRVMDLDRCQVLAPVKLPLFGMVLVDYEVGSKTTSVLYEAKPHLLPGVYSIAIRMGRIVTRYSEWIVSVEALNLTTGRHFSWGKKNPAGLHPKSSLFPPYLPASKVCPTPNAIYTVPLGDIIVEEKAIPSLTFRFYPSSRTSLREDQRVLAGVVVEGVCVQLSNLPLLPTPGLARPFDVTDSVLQYLDNPLERNETASWKPVTKPGVSSKKHSWWR